jgi:hypothetical protein
MLGELQAYKIKRKKDYLRGAFRSGHGLTNIWDLTCDLKSSDYIGNENID